MKRRAARLSVALIVGTCAAAVLGACSSSASKTSAPSDGPTSKGVDSSLSALVPAQYRGKTLTVGTNAPYAPWEQFKSASDHTIIGFDPDLGQALGQVLGVKVQFSQQPFDGLIPGLQAGKYQMLMAGMYDTKKRQEQVTYVDYARDGDGILVPKGNPKKIVDATSACGKKFAVQTGDAAVNDAKAASAKCTAAGKPAIQLDQYSQVSDAALAVGSGKADALLTAYSNATVIANSGGGNALELVPNLDPLDRGQSGVVTLGIAFNKNDMALATAIQKGLQSLIDDGTYAKLLAKYGMQKNALTQAQINGSQN